MCVTFVVFLTVYYMSFISHPLLFVFVIVTIIVLLYNNNVLCVDLQLRVSSFQSEILYSYCERGY